jgi:tetratricopeptide (TPR) repeat protein
VNLIRRILSHGFLILLIAGAALAWYYRSDIFPANKADETALKDGDAVVAVQSSDELAENNKTASSGSDDQESAAAQGQTFFGENNSASNVSETPQYRPLTAETEPDNQVDGTAENATGEVSNASDTESDGAVAKTEPRYRPLTSETETGVADDQSAAANVSETESATAEVTGESEVPVDSKLAMSTSESDQQPVVPEQTVQADEQITGSQTPALANESQPQSQSEDITAEPSQQALQLISSAREAFWRRDIESAEKNYRALIDLQAENPDPYGELGNVFYSAGQWDKAAEAYYEAGVRLIKLEQYGQTMHLVSVLRGLNADRAGKLDKSLREALPQPAATPANPAGQ